MFGKNQLIKEFIEWLEKHGIDPLFPDVLILLLLGIGRVKDIKRWDTLSQTAKA